MSVTPTSSGRGWWEPTGGLRTVPNAGQAGCARSPLSAKPLFLEAYSGRSKLPPRALSQVLQEQARGHALLTEVHRAALRRLPKLSHADSDPFLGCEQERQRDSCGQIVGTIATGGSAPFRNSFIRLAPCTWERLKALRPDCTGKVRSSKPCATPLPSPLRCMACATASTAMTCQTAGKSSNWPRRIASISLAGHCWQDCWNARRPHPASCSSWKFTRLRTCPWHASTVGSHPSLASPMQIPLGARPCSTTVRSSYRSVPIQCAAACTAQQPDDQCLFSVHREGLEGPT